MEIQVLPPDPRLNGWPKPVGVEENDLPNWLNEYGFIVGSYLSAAHRKDWRVIAFNCFHKKAVRGC